MRAYFLCNYYLSSIQQGIQAAHCLAEMSVTQNEGFRTVYDNWAKYHKTMVILNGGNSSDIIALDMKLCDLAGLQYPTGIWTEDAPSLNNAVTCCGIIVSTRICGWIDVLRSPDQKLESWTWQRCRSDYEIAKLLASLPLAR